ncbi:MAG: tetratricopeptide repeat protein [Phycisphaerales bacterium]|nr:MAG: tetratricopeptide repeat protein [Phycisphaerales bacterium]
MIGPAACLRALARYGAPTLACFMCIFAPGIQAGPPDQAENTNSVDDRPPDRQHATFTIPLPEDLAAMESTVVEAIQEAVAQAKAQTPSALGHLAMLYHANYLVPLSVPCYQRTIELDPDNARWHYLLALAVEELGDLNLAAEELRAALRLSPDYAGALFRLGQVLLNMEQTEQAAEVFERLCTVSPETAGGYFGLGRVEYRRKNYGQARLFFARAYERAPNSKRVLHQLGLVLRRLGRTNADQSMLDAAKECLKAAHGDDYTALVTDPWERELLEASVMTAALAKEASDLLTVGRRDEAAAVFERLIQRQPGHWGFTLQLANLRYRQGRHQESRALLERTVQIAPQNAVAWASLAEICGKTGDLQAACEAVERAMALAPDDDNLAYLAARLFLAAGRLTESVEVFQRVMQRSQGHAQAAAQLAEALNRLGRYAEAVAAARTAVVLDPQSAYAHFQLGAALDQTGDTEGAERELRITLSLEPSSKTTRDYLEWMAERRSAEAAPVASSGSR